MSVWNERDGDREIRIERGKTTSIKGNEPRKTLQMKEGGIQEFISFPARTLLSHITVSHYSCHPLAPSTRWKGEHRKTRNQSEIYYRFDSKMIATCSWCERSETDKGLNPTKEQSVGECRGGAGTAPALMGVGEEVRGQRILQFHSSLSSLCTVRGSL